MQPDCLDALGSAYACGSRTVLLVVAGIRSRGAERALELTRWQPPPESIECGVIRCLTQRQRRCYLAIPLEHQLGRAQTPSVLTPEAQDRQELRLREPAFRERCSVDAEHGMRRRESRSGEPHNRTLSRRCRKSHDHATNCPIHRRPSVSARYGEEVAIVGVLLRPSDAQ